MDDTGMDKRTRDKIFRDITADRQKPKKSSGMKTFWIVLLILVIAGALAFFYFKGGFGPTGGAVAETSKQPVSKAAGAGAATTPVLEKHLAESTDVIENTLLLRQYSNEAATVKTAETVSWLNKEVENYDVAELRVAWQTIVGCVYQKCADNVYFSMIDAISMKLIARNNNEVIHSLIETFNLWNGKNQIYFSDSLAKTNSLIVSLKNQAVNNAWDDLVRCNGQCTEFSSKTLGLIKLINEAK